MKIKINYKTVEFEFHHIDKNIKIENLKKGLKNSLWEFKTKEIVNSNSEKKSNVSNQVNDNDGNTQTSLEIPNINKVESLNSTSIDYNSIKREINELLNENYEWKFFIFDEKSKLYTEKTNNDVIKIPSILDLYNSLEVEEKIECFSLKLVLNAKIKKVRTKLKETKPDKTSKNKKFDEFIVDDKKDYQIEDLIMKVTGANEKLVLEKKNTSSRIDMIGGDGRDFLIQALMSLESENPQASSLLENMILNRLSSNNNNNVRVSTGTSTTNQNQNQPQQNRNSNIRISLMDTVRRAQQQREQRVAPDETKIAMLLEMGFEESRARKALVMSRNNLEAAVEIIANDQDLGVELEMGGQTQSSNLQPQNQGQVNITSQPQPLASNPNQNTVAIQNNSNQNNNIDDNLEQYWDEINDEENDDNAMNDYHN